MFTGLVESTGEVVEVERSGGAFRLAIESSLDVASIEHGESIAVDGVCLTVVERGAGRFHVDVIPETLRCTALADVRAGRRVNLERSLSLGDRLGGHLVQGHVDAAAFVRVVKPGDDYRIGVEPPLELQPYVALKGSVALDGVSLTVARLDSKIFEVALIPETLERTTLGLRRVGDRINVEVDLVARYLERLLQTRRADPDGV
jgi:riboflavin synthase